MRKFFFHHLKVSKTDQLRKRVDVFVGRTGGVLCLVQVFVNYVSERGCSLKFMNGDPPKFVAEALQAVGLPYDSFAGHSFCIGAATAAGLEDSVIQMLGRWNSSAFLSYIRTPRDSNFPA